MPLEIAERSFIQFLFKEKRNEKMLLAMAVCTILQFIIFKLLYPFADFFSDSYSYIYAASANLDISIWPIGYSKFLRIFHWLTPSDTAVVAFQYFFLEVSAAYLFFSLLFFFNPSKGIRNTLFVVFFVNPLFLYISNYINSDPLFGALSLLWFTQLLWITYKPSAFLIFSQGLLLFLAFTVRNNAYYYPFVATTAILISKHRVWLKLSGILFPILLIGPFILLSQNAAYKMTGKRQFSLFTGWQLANNALYMYSHIKVDSNQLPTSETKALDRLSREFYGNIPSDFDVYLFDYVANYFIREPESPLKRYFYTHFHPTSENEIVTDWGKASITFELYGKWLIEHYPLQYAKHFMLLNTKNFFFPPLEKLETYNLGQDQVNPVAQEWFEYKTPNVVSISKTAQGSILFLYPYAFLFVNILLIGSTIWLFTKRKQPIPPPLKSFICVAGAFLAANFIFCISATIVVFRYQFFPLLVTLTSSLFIIEYLGKPLPTDRATKKNKVAAKGAVKPLTY